MTAPGDRGVGGVGRRAAQEAHQVLGLLLADEKALASIDAIAALLAERFRSGAKVLIAGNGGSLCDAVHFAEELTGRFRKDRPALPAIALADAGHITCVGNDYGFEHVFSRAVEALGAKGDVLIGLSTSGNSANVIRAIETAKARGLATVSLLGKGGGKLRGVCDHEIIVAGETADRIQELHMLILHTLVEGVERAMFGVS